MKKLTGAIFRREQVRPQELSNLWGSNSGVHHLAQFFKQAPHHFDSQWREPPWSSRSSISSRHSIATKGAQDRKIGEDIEKLEELMTDAARRRGLKRCEGRSADGEAGL